ncbi:MAG: tetratricopeptide repeat protein [Defluviitaleaceae bacterium]|nr:tetratricopeptide repeat protein [Defluviitaleaceae bacterium]MCL2261875.1 tetratricopeptide repeat protein [Defluviitaleaceae bacterium]
MTKINYLRKCAAEKYNAQDLAAAVEIGEVLLREHEHNQNIFSSGYANDLFYLGGIYEELGNLERAAMLYSDSAAQVSASESEQLTFAERIDSLATVLIRLGVAEAAFFMLGNATAIRRKKLGTASPVYADSLYNLANAAAEIGRRSDALRYHLEALQIRKSAGIIEDIINSLHSLAFLHEAAEEYDKAILYAEMSMKFIGKTDKNYASACNYLAELYDNNKRYEDALLYYDHVIEIVGEEAGREHSAYLNVALRRANLLAKLERSQESLVAHEEICEIFARVTGTKHVFYANCLRGISMLYRRLGEPVRAEEFILEAMKIRRALFEDITLDITFLVRLHLGENNTEKALDALIYALMCSSADSPDFPELLHALVSSFKGQDELKTEFLNTIQHLDNREKLRPIINKWEQWESE